MTAAQAQPVAPQIPALTGLRGLAVAIVVLSHAANEGLLPNVLGSGAGQLGVLLFFVLSGYLMQHLYGGMDFDRVSATRFAVARAARIGPVYLLTLLVSVALGLAWPGFHYPLADPLTFVNAALFLSAPRELWSVPVEVQFYVAFVGLWWVQARSSKTAVALVAVFFLSVFIAVLSKVVADQAVWVGLFAHAFLIGMLVARLVPAGSAPARDGPLFLVALIALMAAFPAVRGAELFGGFYPMFWLDPLRLMMAATVLIVAVRGGGWVSIALGNRAMLWLGQISFGVYLFHRPIMVALRDVAPGVDGAVLALIAVAGTLALASLSFRLVERPAGRAIRRLATAGTTRPVRRSASGRSRVAGTARSRAATGTQA